LARLIPADLHPYHCHLRSIYLKLKKDFSWKLLEITLKFTG
jgi:hypothetical protein